MRISVLSFLHKTFRKIVDSSQALDPIRNRRLAMEEYYYGRAKLNSTPALLTIESTSRCNLRCVMCPHAVGAVDRPKHFDEQLVKRLTKFLLRSDAVQLHGIGEPLN